MCGTLVKMVVDVNSVEYGIVFNHIKSGRNLVGSAFVLEDKGWIMKNKKRVPKWKPINHFPIVVLWVTLYLIL